MQGVCVYLSYYGAVTFFLQMESVRRGMCSGKTGHKHCKETFERPVRDGAWQDIDLNPITRTIHREPVRPSCDLQPGYSNPGIEDPVS